MLLMIAVGVLLLFLFQMPNKSLIILIILVSKTVKSLAFLSFPVGVVHLEEYPVLSLILWTGILVPVLFLLIFVFPDNVGRRLIREELDIILIHELLAGCWRHHHLGFLFILLVFTLLSLDFLLFRGLLFGCFVFVFLVSSSNDKQSHDGYAYTDTDFLVVLVELLRLVGTCLDTIVTRYWVEQLLGVGLQEVPYLLALPNRLILQAHDCRLCIIYLKSPPICPKNANGPTPAH